MIRNRRKRKDYFGDRLFDDPAWDMILDLAIAKARFRRVSVTSLCIASGVPSTTALRWVSVLVECGLFRRENDDSDRRRAFISLTDAGSLKVARYFADIEQLTWAML
jgi:DNA-binding MarR family transcriptional regulator